MSHPPPTSAHAAESTASTHTQRIDLCGHWRLYHFPEGAQPVTHPDDIQAHRLPSIPAQVPGNVELDLQRQGALDDPFYANNIRRLRPLEAHEWWYTRTFDLPHAAGSQRWDLVFAGLDTLATVWVNGVEAGRSANMLVEQRFDVTSALRFGQSNSIAVRLGSATVEARRFHYEGVALSSDHREEALYIRKAAHVWGWDIMPRAVSAGIWRPVWLEPHLPDAIEQIYYWTIGAGPESALLGVHFQFRTAAADLDGLCMHFSAVGTDHSFQFEWPVEFVAGSYTYRRRGLSKELFPDTRFRDTGGAHGWLAFAGATLTSGVGDFVIWDSRTVSGSGVDVVFDLGADCCLAGRDLDRRSGDDLAIRVAQPDVQASGVH
jgi:beta-mannosidase